MAPISQGISPPAAAPHHNNLLVANGVPHTEIPTLCRIYKDHLWTYTDDHLATHNPRPRAAPQREEHACLQELRDDEVVKDQQVEAWQCGQGHYSAVPGALV